MDEENQATIFESVLKVIIFISPAFRFNMRS